MKAAPETVWRCWTDPELFARWFAPHPVKVSDVDYGFYPGGPANLTMTLPDGTVMPLKGCVLECVPARRLVTTDSMTMGYRPASEPFLTAIVDIIPTDEGGTHYQATCLHNDAAARKRHEDMGFFDGWGTVLRQLDELAETL